MTKNHTTEQDRATIETALTYHERTKHHTHRYANSLGYMDWATQPDFFRRYEGAPLVSLRIPNEDRTPAYDRIFRMNGTEPVPVDFNTISEFFYYSLAISAWKQYGENRWALRVNPSSGNLHPTEGYIVAPAIEGLWQRPAVYHYAPREHGLERRTEFSEELWNDLIKEFPSNVFLVGLSTIYWRESWKYGERAYRYCQHDAGHALAALRISSALFGWRLYFLNNVSDEQISCLLGLNHSDNVHPMDRESPDMLVAVLPDSKPNTAVMECHLSQNAVESVTQGKWLGTANKLSKDHHEWQVIDSVSQACRRPVGAQMPSPSHAIGQRSFPNPPGRINVPAGRIIRQRRSALAMDGTTGITRDQFYATLSRVVSWLTDMPWDSISWGGFVHLGLFVHRITGLEPGLYVLIRNGLKRESLKERMAPGFLWQNPPEVPDGLPLYFLRGDDVKMLAAQVSCHQDIAGEGAFSFGMLAEFEPAISHYGAHFYRNLFWETGMVGQVLYLEAEALGIRSTGIGCFFDDSMHEAFGLKSRDYQSLYHFTIGGPVQDTRVTTLAAYSHLQQK